MSLYYFKLRKFAHRVYRSVFINGEADLKNSQEAPEPIKGTEYYDDVDQTRLAALAKYSVTPSSQKLKTTISNVSSQFYQAYGPDFTGKTAAQISVDPPWYYQDLLERLTKVPNLVFKTCHDALAQPPVGNEIICTIRHDVDGDLSAAIQQAKIEHSLGIPTSFYLLHNAPYYGVVGDLGSKKNGNTTTFYRHESSLEAYLEIQSLGHELAVHTDSMDYYQRLNTDGASVLKSELAWLRDNGVLIRGTTAHNSFSVYGCNNYSIFKQRPLSMSTPAGPKAVSHNGRWAPLQILDEAELKLNYEANDLFWQDTTPLLYGCLMTQNNWYIAENQYGLLSPESAQDRPPLKARHGTHDDMIDAISKLSGPAYVKLVVHPMHYGLRSKDGDMPWLPSTAENSHTKQVSTWAGGGSDGLAGASITINNEFDTPDRGLDCYRSGDFRIAVLGGRNTLTTTVSADSKFPQVTARLLRGPLRRPNAIAISASNGDLNSEFTFDCWTKICADTTPDALIVCFQPDVNFSQWLETLLPEYRGPVFVLIEDPDVVLNPEFNRFASNNDNLTVLNPAKYFDEYHGSGKLRWDGKDSNYWAPQGHFIVAQKLAELIIQQSND